MTSPVLAEISRSDLTASPTPEAVITDSQQLASYSWFEASEPTILVPGSPPRWSPPSTPQKLAPDSGTLFIDQNAARNPESPLEPLFRALYHQTPDFNMKEIDLVTDRNNLRKLLRFVQASSKDPFQIQVEIVGDKTVLFTRRERETKEVIRGFMGYGHNFEKAYTKGQAEDTSYHRIIGYAFGGMNFIVRHETDGYIEDKTSPSAGGKAAEMIHNLADSLKALTMSQTKNNPGKASKLVVRAGGKPVDSSSLLEIKTRAVSRALKMAEVIPQLWIGQTPNLAVGYHRKGVFDDVQLRDMNEDIRKWEVANQEVLSNLAYLVQMIITVVIDSGHRNATVKYNGGNKLLILKGEQKRALPDDLYSKLEGKTKTVVQNGNETVSAKGDESPSTDLNGPEVKDADSMATKGQQGMSKENSEDVE